MLDVKPCVVLTTGTNCMTNDLRWVAITRVHLSVFHSWIISQLLVHAISWQYRGEFTQVCTMERLQSLPRGTFWVRSVLGMIWLG